MLYTKNQINKIIDNHERLLEIVDNYVCEKYPKYVNTSCHCHPEYQWEDRGTVEDFCEWIKNKDYTTKHYLKYESN
jgi:hypothetical protein